MKKLTKVIVISVVLLLPVLVFLFLKQFGSNEFALPTYYEGGNPLTECESSGEYHEVTDTFLAAHELSLPTLVSIEGSAANEFKFDLQNVLTIYPEVQTKAIMLSDYSDDASLSALNCELVLGEDRYINQPIYNKFVLIDSNRRIRGYFQVDELDEIERLDMELDILLNYEGR